MVVPLDIKPAEPRRGAWLVPMRYSGRSRQAEYPEKLAADLCPLVLHDPTQDEVECPLRKITASAGLPVGRWDPEYMWPAPPAVPGPREAPLAEQAAFVEAVVAVRLAMTPAVVEHLNTHPPDDPLCEALATVENAAREVAR